MADPRSRASEPKEDDVVLLKDLAPRAEVKGGGKLRFGEPSGPTGKPGRR